MKRVFFLTGCILLISCLPSFSQTLPSGFSSTNISSGWNQPVGAAFTKDGQRLFVWEKGGSIYVCNRDGSGNYVKQATAVLDISGEVLDWRDHGLLGFALDPNFATNGLIYLLYVVDRRFLINDNSIPADGAYNGVQKATIGRVTRYKTITNAGNLVADITTRTILLGETPSTGIPILHESHGLGTLAFASDGTLLVSVGDAASYIAADAGSDPATYYQQALGPSNRIIRDEENIGAFRAQLLNCHNGKLLRIDPATGNGVSSNPFYSAAEPRSPKSRVWAMGFRNPFRIVIRPGTGSSNPLAGDIGEIYVGDVGWDMVEELNIIKEPGMNCGWPLYEGHTSLANYFNLAKINPDEPNPLYGIAGCTQQKFTFNNLLKQATADNVTTIYNPCNPSVAIGTHNRYFHRRPAIDWNHTQNIARVGIFNGNNAAVATIGTPESNVVGTPFPGSCAIGGTWYTGNTFPAGYKNTFFLADFSGQWLKRITIDYTDVVTQVDNFGTGFSNLVCVIENPLPSDGSLVTVEISGTGVKKISYGGNQFPVVKMSSNKIYGPSPLAVNFTGNTSFDPDNNTPITYAWNFGDSTSANNTSTLANPSHTFTFASTPKKYVVKLTVTDNGSPAKSSTDSIIISVNNKPPVVKITSPVKNSTYIVGGDATYPLTATVTDAEHNQGQLKYAWQTILRHNNHEHAEPIDTNRNSQTQISRIGCNGETYYWLIKLTVTDAAGLSTTDSSKIFPACTGGLKGSVTLQGHPAGQWSIPIRVDLYANGNNTTPAYTYNITTNASGNFTINNIPAGTYTIAVKNSHTLKRVMTNQTVVAGGTLTANFGTLLEGDANNDNYVDLLDFSLLLTRYNSSPGSTGADFNGDGYVDLLDFSMLLTNYNVRGQVP